MRATARAATAHHEAGHAVAAILKGVAIEHVTIRPEDGAAGHVRYARPGRFRSRMEREHVLGMIALAGEAAQRRFNARTVRRHHGGGDREAVLAYALDWSGSAAQAKALVNLWQIQAKEVVEHRWPAIQRVAAALLERETLTEAEVRGLTMPGPVA